MSPYSLHFVIATLAATAVTVLLSSSWRQRLVAVIIVPFSFYVIFYNFNYSIINGIFPILMIYAGGAYVCFLFLIFSSFRISLNGVDSVCENFWKIPFLFVLEFVGILYAFAIPWAVDTFPLSNIDAVLFTLFAGVNEGTEEFVVSTMLEKVVFPSVQIFFVLFLVQVAIACILSRINKNLEFVFWKIKYSLFWGTFKIRLLCLQKGVVVLLMFYCLVMSLILPGVVLSAPFKALFQIPVDSELYRNHFVHVDSAEMEYPKNLKNLIVIFMESMETNFEHHTPEIVALQSENTNFIPGGASVSGTSWTIAGIIGKLCGIPLNMPVGTGEYLGNLPTYLPYAQCLMDVLKEKKYNQIYIQGSSGEFTQKRKFWTVHGNVDVHDIEYYKHNGKIPKGYNVFWGFEDRKLYNLAKEELDLLSGQNGPFALYMLTVDTHQPEGFVDDLCAKDFSDVNEKWIKALRCASKQLDDFLNWAKLQPWYANTVISVMGDHTMASLSLKAGVPLSDSLYWTNFIINSDVNVPVQRRQYSSMDMYPTLLEAMGAKLKQHSAGLGRSLYSDSLTMLELYGRKKLDSLLRERSVQYDKFLFGK